MPDTFGRMKVIRVSSGCVNVILCLIGLAILGEFKGAGTLNFVPTQRMNKHLEKYHVAQELYSTGYLRVSMFTICSHLRYTF